MDHFLRNHPLLFIGAFVLIGLAIGFGRRALVARLVKKADVAPLFFDLRVTPVSGEGDSLALAGASRLLLEHILRRFREHGGEQVSKTLVDGYLVRQRVDFQVVTFVREGQRQFILRLALPCTARMDALLARSAHQALVSLFRQETDELERFLFMSGFSLDRDALPSWEPVGKSPRTDLGAR